MNRGAAYADGRIVLQHARQPDGRGRREDRQALKWKAQLGDINNGETMTMAPLVVKDKVLVGNSGGEMGVRGWLTALDCRDGKMAWRAYNTGPDKDVLIGPRFKPFYEQDQGQGPRRVHLAARRVEDRRRHRLGMDRRTTPS